MTDFSNSQCFARKSSRHGTTYERVGYGAAKFTFWPFNSGYASVASSGGRVFRDFHATRLDAVIEAGNYCDPGQLGKYIVDNDLGRAA